MSKPESSSTIKPDSSACAEIEQVQKSKAADPMSSVFAWSLRVDYRDISDAAHTWADHDARELPTSIGELKAQLSIAIRSNGGLQQL